MRRAGNYRAEWAGNTLVAAAGIGGRDDRVQNIKLLIDTGASCTIWPVELLDALGYDLMQAAGKLRLATANGLIFVPLIKVSWFNCLGHLARNFVLAAHTIPATSFDGVLGMDFLVRFKAVISVAEARIYFRQASEKK